MVLVTKMLNLIVCSINLAITVLYIDNVIKSTILHINVTLDT